MERNVLEPIASRRAVHGVSEVAAFMGRVGNLAPVLAAAVVTAVACLSDLTFLFGL